MKPNIKSKAIKFINLYFFILTIKNLNKLKTKKEKVIFCNKITGLFMIITNASKKPAAQPQNAKEAK